MPKIDGAVGPLPKLGGAEVAVLDELDKVHPISGDLIPAQKETYLAVNHLWNAKDRTIRLHAARNEFVAFQILLRGSVDGVRPELTFTNGKAAQVSMGRFAYVPTPKGPMPDPVLPLTGPFAVPTPGEGIDGQKTGRCCARSTFRTTLPAGEHDGTLTLRAGDARLELKVKLRVRDFTLPDFLSFIPEMNCYGLPANEGDYYRLAHRHRTVLNRVPYSQSGNVHDGCVPPGTARNSTGPPTIAVLARTSTAPPSPTCRARRAAGGFYLPLHENWPTPMNGNYNEDYWADRAFPERYRETFVKAPPVRRAPRGKGLARHALPLLLQRQARLQEERLVAGSSPWLLDEPASFQDYWALRYSGPPFTRASVGQQARLLFRADISRPQ